MGPWVHHGRRELCVAVLVLALSAALAPGSALGSFPGGNGVIAYSAGGSIWAVDPSTGNQLRLTSGPDDSAPAFSPSGNLLAFQRWASGSLTIYLANANGSDARPLVRGAEPAFAPSGRQIVFVRRGGIFITGIAPGSTAQQLTHQPGDRGPQWSSKGSIVFERTDEWRVRHQGRRPNPLSPRSVACGYVWSSALFGEAAFCTRLP